MNLVNGIASDAVSVRDRGLAYGDGVFRTFPMRSSRPVLWQRQYAKLARDCQTLNLNCPALALLDRDMASISAAEPDCVVKIIITRGDGARGYALPAAATPTRVVMTNPLPSHIRHHQETGVRLHLCRIRLAIQPALAGVKHLNRLENVLARAEWSEQEIAEGLMCDTDGNVICGTMSNLFAIKNGTLLTPELTRCGVSGVMRDLVIELAGSHGIPVQTTAIRIDDLLAVDELFVVNSVIGLWPVIALDRKAWNLGTLTAQLQRWISDAQGD